MMILLKVDIGLALKVVSQVFSRLLFIVTLYGPVRPTTVVVGRLKL